MLKLVAQRVVATIPLLFIVSVLTFALLQLLPSDPVLVRLGEDATAEQYDQMQTEMGLDEPLVTQYVQWLGNAITGDFGASLTNGQDVSRAVLARLPITLSLTFGAIALGLVIGVGAGIVGGTRPGARSDRGVTFLATIGLAVPNFWFALLLVTVFSLGLGWFPATGYTPLEASVTEWGRSVLLPCIALGVSAAAAIARQTRSALTTVLQQDYIRTAIAKGASIPRVVLKHALKNAMIPVVTVLAFQFTTLLGGALVVERVFVLPGLGSLAIDAVLDSDVTMAQGMIMYTAVVVVIVNLVTDLAYGYFNPKVRSA